MKRLIWILLAAPLFGQTILPSKVFINTPGTYTNTQMNLYMQTVLNSCSPLTEFQAIQASQTQTEGITGCNAAPAFSSVYQASGLAGYASGISTATNVVGIYGQGRARAAGVKAWGSKVIAYDSGFISTSIFGQESVIDNSIVGSAGAAYLCSGTVQIGSSFNCLQVAQPATGPWSAGADFLLNCCTNGIKFETGATIAPSSTAAAISFNPVASGTNKASQGVTYISGDPSSGQNTVSVNESAAGDLTIVNSKAGKGVTINGNQAVQNIANGTVDLTGQTAAVGTTTLYSVPASGAGQYRVIWDSKITTAAGTSSTLGPLTITYTDPDGTVISTTMPGVGANPSTGIGESVTGNTTSTLLFGFPILLNCKASTVIQYAFGYASNAANAMTYNLHIRLEGL